MVHFAFLSLGSRGDIQPGIVIGKKLIELGHKVTLSTSIIYKDWIETNGINYHQLTTIDAKNVLQSAEGQQMLRTGKTRQLINKLKQIFPPCFKEAEELIKRKDIDVVISISMIFDTCYCLCEKYQKKFIRLGLVPLVSSRSKASVFTLKDSLPLKFLNRLSHLLVDLSWWNKQRKELFNTWRTKVLNLPKITNFNGPIAIITKQNLPYLLAISSSVCPKIKEWGIHSHVTGYLYWNHQNLIIPKGLTNFLKDKNKPPIYIGFGSMSVADSKQLYDLIIKAIKQTNNRVIICSGWSLHNQDQIIQNNENIFICSQVSHSWLFPQCKMVIHHGGAGTTAEGLRAGIPSIICSFFLINHIGVV